MREHYLKTFRGMQVTIAMLSFAAYAHSRLLSVAFLFFITMQVGAVLGAFLAARVRSRAPAAPGRTRA